MPAIRDLKLKPEVKALWLEALRSGEYTQGMWELRTSSGCFCCLGVLTEICPLDSFTNEQGRMVTKETILREDSYLPYEAAKWAFEGVIPGSDAGGHSCTIGLPKGGENLSKRNDSGDWDFNAIADLIEENF